MGIYCELYKSNLDHRLYNFFLFNIVKFFAAKFENQMNCRLGIV